MAAPESIWTKGFAGLGQAMKGEMFRMDYEDFFGMVAKNESLLNCFCIMYGLLINKNPEHSLEKLSKKEKADIWEEAKRLCGEGCTQEKAIKMSKVIQYLGIIVQQ